MLKMQGAVEMQARDLSHLQTSHLLSFGRRAKRKSQRSLPTCVHPLTKGYSTSRHLQAIRRQFVVKCENGGDVLVADNGKSDPLDRFVLHSRDTLHQSEESLQVNNFGWEIWRLALPALVTQAVEPMAQVMETAYIGRLGSVELAAVGVSVSVFNLVSKIFNIPLLNITTSFVARDDALIEGGNVATEKPVIPAVSSSLFLALILALVEAAVLFFGIRSILTLMGVHAGSPMRSPAMTYLSVRALGAPANVLALTIQGIFRGFKDTKTSLYAVAISNIFNIALSPVLIFKFRFGVIGAGVATVASQYFLACILLWSLSKRVRLVPPDFTSLRLIRLLKSGGFLIWRTMSVLFTMTLATSMAARQGTIPMAGHQILLQIWLATSLLSDSISVAGHAILASAYAKGDLKKVKEVAYGVLQMGLCFGLLLAFVLSVSMGSIANFFTRDAAVLQICSRGVLFVASTQPLNALAFVFDGLHYGISDFKYAALSTMVVGLLSSCCLLIAPSFIGLPGVWLGLAILMGSRAAAGWLRLNSTTGPWRFLKEEI